MILRAGWLKTGDVLAIDQRNQGPTSGVELYALGRAWLGPSWTSGLAEEPASPARLTRWKGALDLIAAIGALGRRDLCCVLVGSEQRRGFRKELDVAIARLGLAGLAGAMMSAVWNYVVSAAFVWRSR